MWHSNGQDGNGNNVVGDLELASLAYTAAHKAVLAAERTLARAKANVDQAQRDLHSISRMVTQREERRRVEAATAMQAVGRVALDA